MGNSGNTVPHFFAGCRTASSAVVGFMEVRVGCSGWFYQHWKGKLYPTDLPKSRWFSRYAKTFDTVELNAPFYRWPPPATVEKWAKEAPAQFRYTVKVNRLITHLKRLHDTEGLIDDFCNEFSSILGGQMGRFLFQFPPRFDHSISRLRAITTQLRPGHCVEFRHPSWWNREVFKALKEQGITFCSVSGMGMPDELVKNGPEIYLRLHGPAEVYTGDYPLEQLRGWARRLHQSGARRVWVYFNNDREGFAVTNALALRGLLEAPKSCS